MKFLGTCRVCSHQELFDKERLISHRDSKTASVAAFFNSIRKGNQHEAIWLSFPFVCEACGTPSKVLKWFVEKQPTCDGLAANFLFIS